MSFPIVPQRNEGRRFALLVAALSLVGLAFAVGTHQVGLPDRISISCIVVVQILIGSVVFLACRRAAQAPGRNDRRVWRLFATGMLLWTLGALPYLVNLHTGGDWTHPAYWTQIGYLAAYPFWYRALWLQRQPAVATSRLRRLEAIGLESAALVTIIVLAGAILWSADTTAASNIAQMVPVTLDVLLGAALYNAARRTSLTTSSAYLWFLVGFGVLALADAATTLVAGSGLPGAVLLSTASIYSIAIASLGWASTQGLQITDARRDLTSSHIALGMVSLVLITPAASLTPPAWRFGWWILGALIVWRVAARFFRRDDEKGQDLLTGMSDPRAFEQYLEGLVRGSTDEQQALVIAVDLNGFSAWNQAHGFGAGDELLVEVAGLLGGTAPLANGSWGRLGADSFVWAGVGESFEAARALAEMAASVASDNRGQVAARASFALVPRDAASAADAMSAVEEGLGAAREMSRSVVAFDRGELDGFELRSGYTASLRRRRARVEAVLAEPESISSVVQPIVELTTGRVAGHEALSRFMGEPHRGPDAWIAEAAAVGLGIEVEAQCLRRALERRGEIPEGTYLSVNASGELIHSALFDECLGDGPLEDIVIEITEHEKVDDYGALNQRLAAYRARGARVAVDDAGAGHSSMRHIIELSPDLVKVDRSLISGVQDSEGQQAMISSLLIFSAQTGASLVAEGAEDDAEISTLRTLGVPLCQGYGIGRPAPAFATGAVSLTAAPTLG